MQPDQNRHARKRHRLTQGADWIVEPLELRLLLAGAVSTTTLATSAPNAIYGQSVQFSATVTGNSSTPTGTVTFFDGATSLGTGSLNSSGVAMLVTGSLSVASHSIKAKYGGNGTYANSTSSILTQPVAKDPALVSTASSTPTAAPLPAVPSHVVVVFEEDRASDSVPNATNPVGDTTDMPYLNQVASSGLVYDSQGLNDVSQEGQMNYLAMYSGSTQGVTDNDFDGPFSAPNLAQSLYNAGLNFTGYAEGMPHDGDTTDQYAASPTNPAYDDLYTRSYNPMAQFTNVGTNITNAMVNKTFASFPTATAGYAALPTVSFVVPDTLDNTHGSNDTDPYATDPGQYDFLRKNADNWLQTNINGYLQWAKSNNSLLIIISDEGDRAHGFVSATTDETTMVVNGSSNLFTPGIDEATVNPYNVLRTIEDMYSLPLLGNTATASDLDLTTADGTGHGKLSPAKDLSGQSADGQAVSFTASVGAVAPGIDAPTGSIQFQIDGVSFGSPVTLTSGQATSPTTTTLAPGTHTISALYSGDGDVASATVSTLTQTVLPAPVTVSSVVINGNNAALAGTQRSMVDSIVYTFSEAVTPGSNAFTIAVHTGEQGTAPGVAWAAINPDTNGASPQWVVTFTGASVIGNSIANGVYDITLNASAVSSEANPTATITPRVTDTFYRLYGDFNGDQVVNATDNLHFKNAITTYNPIFDYDNNGAVNATDNLHFKASISFVFNAAFTVTI
jgi:acid phosphatase